jgi:hypothetical protein
MPVLDVTKLNDGLVSKLAEIFDRYCNKEFRRLPEQFKTSDIVSERFGGQIQGRRTGKAVFNGLPQSQGMAREF